MKSSRRLLSILTACSMALCITSASMAAPTVYDVTSVSGQGFSVADDGVTVTGKIYPGDKIANTEIYLGVDNMNSGAAEGFADVLDDGTPCWVNKSGRVYSVSSYQVDTGMQQTDEMGEPVFDEAGNPVNVMASKYVLDTTGGIVEVAYGDSNTDAMDPAIGGSAKDTAYSLRGDLIYSYTDDTGVPQNITAADIDAAAYPNGTMVYLTYDAPADPTMVFQGWSIYKVQPDGSLAKTGDDQIAQLGIPEIPGPDQLKADAVNAAGGRLNITVNGMNDHLVFVPVFAAAPQEPAVDPNAADPNAVDPNAVDPNAVDPNSVDPNAVDPNAVDPNAVDPNAVDPNAVDPNVIEISGDNAEAIDAELNADGVIVAEQGETTPPAVTYEIYVDYIDPDWNGPSTGYYMYSGGDFSADITTAANNPEGLVFSAWTADSDAVIIEPANSAQAALRINTEVPMTESRVIRVTASYVQPEPVIVRSALTVVDGTVEGDLDLSQVEEGTSVTVSAAEKAGMEFVGWTADSIDLNADQLSAPVLTFTMPANAVTMTAQYKMEETQPPTEAPTEAPATGVLTAQNATIDDENATYNGDGTVSVTVVQGSTVTVTANAAPEGQEFGLWNVSSEGTVATSDVTNETIQVTVSDSDVSLQPVYVEAQDIEPVTEQKVTEAATEQKVTEAATEQKVTEAATEQKVTEAATEQKVTEAATEQKVTEAATEQKTTEETMAADEEETPKQTEAPVQYTLTVTSGTADQTVLEAGKTATVTANAAAAGYKFSSWTVSGSGSVADPASASTTFTMGTANATVTANYVPVLYTLTVKNGYGSGSYANGAVVDITANYPESGKEFDTWVNSKGTVYFDDATDYYAEATMTAADATVKATYRNGPDPNNNAITGLENGKEYLKGTTLSFTAVGAGMEKEGKNPGDYRYKPTGYQIGGVTGSWSSSPYTTSMAINAAGDYTLTVTYAKELYDGVSWAADGTTVSKSITFHIVTALSVNTGDSSPLLPLFIAGGAALAVIIALIIILIRRKRR